MSALQHKVNSIVRRARRLQWQFAAARFLTMTLAALLVLGAIDFLIRFQDRGLRVMATAGALAAVGWAAWRYLRPAWHWRCSPVRVALRIEQRLPQLRGLLANSIEYLGHSAQQRDLGGSPRLRQAVIAQAESVAGQLNLAQVLESRAARRATLAALAGLMVLCALCAWNIDNTLLAARRLLNPWNAAAWPRRHELAFLNPPARLASGQDFEVELTDRKGRLPRDVQIQYWFAGDSEDRVSFKPMKPLADKMTHRMDNVSRSFRFRAWGGDDHRMPWLDVTVVEPPRVTDHSVRLQPPDYTGLPASQSSQHIRALEGTRAGVQGIVNRPVAAINLITDSVEQSGAEVILDPRGRSFRIAADSPAPWVLQQSGTYGFELLDREGLRSQGTSRWDVQVVPDLPPSVSLESPANQSVATGTAHLPVVATIKDDLALERIELNFSRSDRSQLGLQSLILFQGPPHVAPSNDAGQSSDGELAERSIEWVWDLSSLPSLEPGAWIEFHISASDYKPQSGQSRVRRIAIISPEQLQERLAQKQAQLLSQLLEALQTQRESRWQTKALEIQWQEASQPAREDVDQLQTADLLQRRVESLIARSQNGALAVIDGILAELRNNRSEHPELQRHMKQLTAGLEQVQQQWVPSLRGQFAQVLRSTRAALDPSADRPDPPQLQQLAQSLARVGSDQERVIELFERLIDGLNQWDSYRRFGREIGRLRRDQDELRQRALRLGSETLARNPKELPPRQRAQLEQLATRQSDMARQLEKTLGGMEQTRDNLSEQDPLARETLADTLEAARRLGVTARMRESARDLRGNRMGQATENQNRTERDLRELADILANRREHELSRVLRQLKEAAQQLQAMRDEQESLRRQAAADEREESARQQRDLGERLRQLGRRLRRLQAERSSELVDQAGQQTQAAGQARHRQDEAKAEHAAEQAEQLMREAQQQLTQEVEQVRNDLAVEQMASMRQWIAGLKLRQQSALDTTLRIDQLRTPPDRLLGTDQQAAVGRVADEQASLATETGALADELIGNRVLVMALELTVRPMGLARQQLARLETGDATQRQQQRALSRLTQIEAALVKEAPQESEAPDEGQPPAPATQPPAGRPLDVTELKLIAALQEELQRETQQLQRSGQNAQPGSQAWQRQHAELAQRQGRLADLVVDLLAPATQPPPADATGEDWEQDLDKALERDLDRALDDGTPQSEEDPS